MPKLRNWCFANALNFPVNPEVHLDYPEYEQARLFGYVFDDNRKDFSPLGEAYTAFHDGHRIITSPVKKIDLENKYVITRSGTRYILEGEMNQAYKEWLDNPVGSPTVFDMVEKLLN